MLGKPIRDHDQSFIEDDIKCIIFFKVYGIMRILAL
jgi:hypothetical protein